MDTIEHFDVFHFVEDFGHYLVVLPHPIVQGLDPAALKIAFSSGYQDFNRDKSEKKDHERRV